MTALFEPDAVIDIGGGTFLRGKEAMHEFFTQLQVTGFGPEKRKFEFGEQRPALICGDLALTSTRSRDGTVTSEVARRQKDGTWLWVIDRYSVSWVKTQVSVQRTDANLGHRFPPYENR
jgi:hypothetical protein